MKGVTMLRVVFGAHAYCLGTDGGEDGGACPFQRYAGGAMTATEVRGEAQRHVRETGHVVLVDIVDRTDYAPEPAQVTQ